MLADHGEPMPEPGTEVELVLESYRLRAPFRVIGRIQNWVRHGVLTRCSLALEDPDATERQVPAELRERFTRRRFPRLQLAPAIPVVIGPTSVAGQAVRGEILDLSEGGLRAILGCPLARAPEVEEWQRVWLVFTLADDTSLRLAAQVRGRSGLRMGFEFDRGREDHDAALTHLRRFIAEQSDQAAQCTPGRPRT
jgi:hypothetical protein